MIHLLQVKGNTAPVPENEEETGVEVQESLPLPSFVGELLALLQLADPITLC